MKKSGPHVIGLSFCFRLIVFLWIALLYLTPSAAGGIETGGTDQLTGHRHRLEVQIGYFTGRREMLRELYGNTIAFGVRYQQSNAKGRSIGLRVGVTELSRNELPWSLLSINVAPMVSFDLQRSQALRLFTSVGAGLSHRKISVADVRQTEWSIFALLELGVDMRLGPQWALGGRVCYDYFPFGDPTRGDFGDTGGLYLLGSIIVNFGH